MTKLETFLSALHYTTDRDDFAVIVKDILRELLKEACALEEAEEDLFFDESERYHSINENGELQL